jgi:uncharacterized membrane protein
MQALHDHIGKDGFRLRGTHMSRVDAFSDVVFGFAITLLVVSLEVPRTFDELNRSLRGFIPFAICFLLLLLIWYSHYKFFHRYGLHDLSTISINAALLFVVLFYVYPLKFLFTVLAEGWLGRNVAAFGTPHQMRNLLVLYGVGFATVYFLFTALYANAWRQRRSLHLNPAEEFLTRSSIIEYALMGSVGLTSALFAVLLSNGYSGFAGFWYYILIPIGIFHGRWERRRATHILAQTGDISSDVPNQSQ